MEELDLSCSFPVRSRLYSPEPIGLGTGRVESASRWECFRGPFEHDGERTGRRRAIR